jgi:hypothetical protein
VTWAQWAKWRRFARYLYPTPVVIVHGRAEDIAEFRRRCRAAGVKLPWSLKECEAEFGIRFMRNRWWPPGELFMTDEHGTGIAVPLAPPTSPPTGVTDTAVDGCGKAVG